MYFACERQDETDALDRAISKMTRVMKCAAPAAKRPPDFTKKVWRNGIRLVFVGAAADAPINAAAAFAFNQVCWKRPKQHGRRDAQRCDEG